MSANAIATYAAAAQQSSSDLASRHFPLVTQIARHLAARLPEHVDVDDLIQAGMIGLLEAVKNYDGKHAAGASFATFAGLRIRGAMLDEIRRNGWAPRSVHRHVREMAQVVRAIEQETGRHASSAAIAQRMGIPVDELHHLSADAARSQVIALESISNDEGEPLGVAEHSVSPVDHLQSEEFQAGLADAIAQLPERERTVLALYYQEELNLKEIGAVLGVSESRVCQIHGRALVHLRARMTDH